MAREEAKYKNNVAKGAKIEYELKQKTIDFQSRGLDIQSELLESIGGPVEQIVAIESQRVGLAMQARDSEEERLRRLEEAGASEAELNEARLSYAKADAEVTKRKYGAQNSMLDKMFGNMIGAFGEVAGIMGPNNDAAKYGMGYVQLANGTVAENEGYNGGYRDRLFTMNAEAELDNETLSPMQKGHEAAMRGPAVGRPDAMTSGETMASHANGETASEAAPMKGKLALDVTFDFDSGNFKSKLGKYVVSMIGQKTREHLDPAAVN
jgi:hypothetical protein